MNETFEVPSKCALEQAPERAALFLLDTTLLIVGEALRCAHPTLDYAFEGAEPPPTLALAALLVRHAERLRIMLRDYEAAVEDALDGAPVDSIEDGFEIPF
jgi:hypothetical protein